MKPKDSALSRDWQGIRERLAAVRAATEAALHCTPEHAQVVMDARAAELARVPEDAISRTDILELITFRVAGQRFGLETRFVREVFRAADVTPVPGAPAFVVGVTNVRGAVLAVMDLARILEIQVENPTPPAWILVLGERQMEIGVVADDVDEVASLRTDEVLNAAGSAAGIPPRYVRGVTHGALVIVDGAALLADPRLFVQDE